MLDFIISMMLTPEAQPSLHYWAAVLLAHVALGMASAAILGALTLDLVLGTAMSASCWAAWEVAQFLWFGGDAADGLVDYTACVCGALLALALWRHRVWLAGWAMMIPFLLIARRTKRRRDPWSS